MLDEVARRVADARYSAYRSKLEAHGAVPILLVGVQPGAVMAPSAVVFCAPPELSGELVRILRSVADALAAGSVHQSQVMLPHAEGG